MKLIVAILFVLLIWLQYKLWLGAGGIPEVLELEQEIDAVQSEVDTLQERNKALDAEVMDLKKGIEAIEERARSEMGMIKKDEIYYQVIDSDVEQPLEDAANE
ncbi:MAG: cell division protein FtsB [Gammaproteobacteria bacterium]